MSKYQVEVSIRITKDGNKFAESEAKYHECDYASMHAIESAVVNSLVGLGDAKVKEAAATK